MFCFEASDCLFGLYQRLQGCGIDSSLILKAIGWCVSNLKSYYLLKEDLTAVKSLIPHFTKELLPYCSWKDYNALQHVILVELTPGLSREEQLGKLYLLSKTLYGFLVSL